MTFTIITVCYNSEKYIEQCIRSVLDQRFSDYEYIIIDGASTDNTLKIVKKYEPEFNGRMYFISEKDTGIYNAMNKGIKHAQGNYVLFLNSDDYYDPEMLQNIDKNINGSTVDCYYGDCFFIDGKKSRNNIPDINALYNGMSLNHMAMAVKRSVITKLNGFNEQYRVAADWDFSLRLLLGDYHFSYIPEPHSYFRIGGISSDNLSYKHELISVYNRLLKKDLGLSYEEIQKLFKTRKLSKDDIGFIEECMKKIMNSKNTLLVSRFLKSFSIFSHNYYLHRIYLMKHSFSWIITKPIRLVGSILGVKL